MGERLFYTQKVIGSIPISPTIHKDEMKSKYDDIFVLILVATWAVHYMVIPLFSHFF